ncbi:uncharacterized protein HaLaN_28799, partial [Haematococcus lacustris]
MLLGHFLSMVCSLWLLSVVGEGRGLRFQGWGLFKIELTLL